jgi:hypothetical protein
MFLAKDHAVFDNDLVKLAGWADIGQHLLCGFRERDSENCDSMGTACREMVGPFYLEVQGSRGKLS